MEQVIKDTFIDYRVIDCTNKNNDAINTIVKLCHANKNIIVYIKRHENNQKYFQFIEMMEKQQEFHDPKPLVELVLNLDNYVGFRESNITIDKKIRDIRKSLLDDDECSICMEKKSESTRLFVCANCSNSTCMKCLGEHIKSQVIDGKATKDFITGKIYFECASCRQLNSFLTTP
jgi:hypothetical protein